MDQLLIFYAVVTRKFKPSNEIWIDMTRVGIIEYSNYQELLVVSSGFERVSHKNCFCAEWKTGGQEKL